MTPIKTTPDIKEHKEKPLQFLYWLEETSYGKTTRHWLIEDCADEVTTADEADTYLQQNMAMMMAKNDWSTVLNFKVTKIGYDLKTPAKKDAIEKKAKAVAEKETKKAREAEIKAIRAESRKIQKGDSQEIQMQKIIFAWFDDIDDKTVVKFVDSFTYFTPNPEPKVKDLIEKFLAEQELAKAYCNWYMDITSPAMFMRTSMSDRNIFNQINSALFNLCFNRFRDSVL